MKRVQSILFLTLIGALLVVVLWRQSILLSLLLTLLAILKAKYLPIKNELLWFLISGIMGTSVESFIMLSGAWSYNNTDFLNFPFWLFFLWGYAGNLGISLYLNLEAGKAEIS